MSIFLDSGNVNEIRKYPSYGVIRGVITNSTNLIKEGIVPGINNLRN